MAAQPAVRGGPLPAGDPVTLDRLRALVSEEPDGLAEVMLARRTQTNEPARCATLLPVLARLPPPLALIEVGASAGLTLLADRPHALGPRRRARNLAAVAPLLTVPS